jgi:hypothetical protein
MTKIKNPKTIFDDSPQSGASTNLIQICDIEDHTRQPALRKGLHLLVKENRHVKTKEFGWTFYTPSYGGLRAMIDGMVEIYGIVEVERELGIKIKGGERKI